MNYINFNSIKKKAINSKKFLENADKKANKIFEKNKNTFIEDFDNHPVTQEIQAGPEAKNISKTLNGKGNLFSFIGFNETDSPIDDLREILTTNFSIKRNKVSSRTVSYRIKYPTLEKIKAITSMPWEAGKSWVKGIETGISGLSFYLYKRFKASRSGAAIQAQNEIKPGAFKNIPYLSQMIKKFKDQF